MILNDLDYRYLRTKLFGSRSAFGLTDFGAHHVREAMFERGFTLEQTSKPGTYGLVGALLANYVVHNVKFIRDDTMHAGEAEGDASLGVVTCLAAVRALRAEEAR